MVAQELFDNERQVLLLLLVAVKPVEMLGVAANTTARVFTTADTGGEPWQARAPQKNVRK